MGGLDRFINHKTPQLGWIRDVEPLKGPLRGSFARTETSMGLCNYGSAWSTNSAQFGPKIKVKTTSNPKRKPSKTRTNYDFNTPLSNLIFIHKVRVQN
ncbi:MAG: hypothetical protein Ct9H300mP19_00060 [Dehalococcoidia bacterium]|nr:MAG: hypothetical protein Ct9H300mP19_00060 [Dehalococcoidia bacterium]